MFLRIGILVLIATAEVGFSSDILKNIYFNRVHCKVNPDYCPQPICKLSFITRKVKSFTWICNLTKPVDLVNLQATLFYRFRNGYQKFLIDLNIDVCSYYNNSLGSAVMDLVRKELEQYSTNVIRACPYTGNMTVIGLPLTGALFDYIFLPSGEYKLNCECETNVDDGTNRCVVRHQRMKWNSYGNWLQVIDGKFDKKKLFGILMTVFFSVPAGLTLEDDNMG